jgi:hypothetical protein
MRVEGGIFRGNIRVDFTPLPTSPARGEVLIEYFERLVSHMHNATLAGRVGEGVRPSKMSPSQPTLSTPSLPDKPGNDGGEGCEGFAHPSSVGFAATFSRKGRRKGRGEIACVAKLGPGSSPGRMG